jgi:ABC-type branched-subunit amino acid transport system substrate-binding protein
MSRKGLRQVAFAVLALGVLLLSGRASGATGTPQETIRIGAIADLSQQPGSAEGEILRATLDSAVSKINADGGINGRSLEIVYLDPRDDPAEAMAQVRRLVSRGQVDVLFGGTLNSECAATQELAGWVQIAYVMGSACSGDRLTAGTCNEYSFRFTPAGRQVTEPLAAYITGNLGKRWAIIYPDYLPGKTQVADWRDSLKRAGSSVNAEIAVPVGAADVAPYLATFAADSSISGIILAGPAADQRRLLEELSQIGLAERYPIVGTGDWAGYHDAGSTPAFSDLSLVEIQPVGAFPGDQKSTAAAAASDRAAIMALKAAMLASDFTDRTDTKRLIAALESISISGGKDGSLGQDVMDKADHQGRMEENILKIQGQTVEVVQDVSPGQLPMIGNCHV